MWDFFNITGIENNLGLHKNDVMCGKSLIAGNIKWRFHCISLKNKLNKQSIAKKEKSANQQK